MRRCTIAGVTALLAFVLAFGCSGKRQTDAAPDDGRSSDKARVDAAPDDKKQLTLDLGGGVTMKLALIPAGKFLMGSPSGEALRFNDEGPLHTVTISKPFYMGVTEVTQAQYQAIMGSNPSGFKGAQSPVESLSWEDAVTFCRKLSAKVERKVSLPTEAQWEYACRAGSKTRFGFGDSDTDLGAYAWYSGNSDKVRTHEVGRKKPNAFGLYDMHGNVWEWCADWYGESYYGSSQGSDPHGPSSGKSRVFRGGSWAFKAERCRAASRDWFAPGRRNHYIGFRVVVSSGVD